MLAETLTARYGLREPLLTPAPRGFVAETYYATADTARYFVKIVARPADADRLRRSLPVLQALHRHGVTHIPAPVPTLDGRLSIPYDNRLLALFSHVNGQQSFDFPLAPYAHLLAQCHAYPCSAALPRETFVVSFKDELLQNLERAWSGRFDNPHQQALHTWSLARRSTVQRDLALLDATAEALQAAKLPYVLTHGDAPGNVLVNGDQIALVDWDDVLLAPRERDIWFHRYDAAFMALYRAHAPGYEPDPVVCRYYLYYRYMEDMLGYFDKILSPQTPDCEKAHHYRELVEDCDEWLAPLMAADRLT